MSVNEAVHLFTRSPVHLFLNRFKNFIHSVEFHSLFVILPVILPATLPAT